MGETKHLPDAATVYLNGQFVAATEARLPVDDRGLLYGLGFFETFRTSGGRPHHWNHHQSRLEAACARAGIALDSMLARDRERLSQTVRELLRVHDLPDAVFRYTVTAGAAAPVARRFHPASDPTPPALAGTPLGRGAFGGVERTGRDFGCVGLKSPLKGRVAHRIEDVDAGVEGLESPLERGVARSAGVCGLSIGECDLSAQGPALRAGRDHVGPAELLTLRPLPPPPPSGGVSLRVLNLARDNGEWLPRPKSLNYANAFLGAEELRARSSVAGDEGLFLSRDGSCVVETARQNIFWIAGNTIRYPDPGLGAVAGTCLAWLLGHGRSAQPSRASLAELLTADAIAVCNAVRGITPVREVWDTQDQTRLGTFASATHPLVTEFSERWRESLQATAGGAP